MKPTDRVERRRHIPTLDGWRALAIFLVIVFHVGAAYHRQTEFSATLVGRFGRWGVPIFFGLSGLLITKLLLEESDRTGAISLKSFYLRRAFRILPPVFIYIGVIGALGLIVSPTEVASSLLFFRNYLPEPVQAGVYTGHFWSLAVEEHFYLLWPGLLVLVGIRRGLVAAATLSVAFALWASADFHWHIFDRVFSGFVTQPRSDLRMEGLFCGCTMAFLVHHPAPREWLRRYYSIGIWLALAVAFPFCLQYQPPLTHLWLAALIPSLMVGTLLHPEWAVSRFLELGPIKWLGRISYSLYVWQEIFLVPSWEPQRFGAVQRWPLDIVLALACACLSYYLIERPAIRFGHSLSKRWVALPRGYTPPRIVEQARAAVSAE